MKKRSLSSNSYHQNLFKQNPKVIWLEQQKVKIRMKRDFFVDPLWPNMWYMNEKVHPSMNIMDAYKRFNMTGDGIAITILDDGIEKNHTDLFANYDPQASYDFNDNDTDPHPRYDFTDFNRHGTRCAGEVAAIANNNKCGVGIAYKAGIGGIRMLDGDVTDALEAQALSYHLQHIDIFSASWGPTDDGKTLDGPGTLAQKAILMGVQQGRNGLGTIYVWASGNGGRHGDNCNCDGYTNSMYTLSVSSVTSTYEQPDYLERCSSTLAATYSSGSDRRTQIITTDLHDGCTDTHSGTSASAPIAAAIIALALQKNKFLTWRDVQHLVVRSSRRSTLKSDDWILNGAGRWFSHAYGYGLMDASKLVELAHIWKTSPKRISCFFAPVITNRTVHGGLETANVVNVSSCTDNNEVVKYIEHVQAQITFSTAKRGDCELHLLSPAGTRSKLLMKRPLDTSSEGIINWPFTSTHFWGENPEGVWSLTAMCSKENGELTNWVLSIHGTSIDPDLSVPKRRTLEPSKKVCEGNEYMLNGACYDKCPQQYFPDWNLVRVSSDTSNFTEILNASTCSPCHQSCRECYGPLKDQCISCSSDRDFNHSNHCDNDTATSAKLSASHLLVLASVCCIISTLSFIFVTFCRSFKRDYEYAGIAKDDFDDYL
ncbi:hypothetical protein HELRODRAFT_105284 [Helobdella robusta]|uniref:P/Homo B domain-containing protein n=1 Tax=Helobdella robusta TaxID=6412 RepID=T1EDT0_HELRO|nr:hypothetical protein HELRODRAFT_105284 [Helobdella robusta]ESO12333.1 hypothetical protein HELRODRAFT_105284 [Helobdella robusta]